MAKQSCEYIRKAIRIYRKTDGASDMGSYRDVITDLLHIAFNDKKLRKNYGINGKKNNLNWIAHLKNQLNEAYLMFEEEREITENSMVQKIPIHNLPLHINEEWEFKSSRKLFEERLKNGRKK